jgi:hypothetical protein
MLILVFICYNQYIIKYIYVYILIHVIITFNKNNTY